MKWEYEKVTIKTFLKMYDNQEIIIKPVFQRNIVWTDHSMAQFIESILMDFPVPQFYFHEKLEDDKRILYVIDGQQRLNSIIKFCRESMILEGLESEEFDDIIFSELENKEKLRSFLAYKLPVVKIINEDDKLIREFYARINKNTVNLNEQEIRKAMYPGAFLDIAETLSEIPFWKNTSFFTKSQKKRMSDVEFISELLVLEMAGIQDKKNNLSKFYENNASMEKDEKLKVMKRFMFKIKIIKKIFQGSDFKKSRLKKQSDFYSMFAYLQDLNKIESFKLIEKNIEIQNLFLLLKYGIAPQSNIEILSTYGIKCVSQANSSSSRTWRKVFLGNLLNYIVTKESNETIEMLINNINEEYELELSINDIDFESILVQIKEHDSHGN